MMSLQVTGAGTAKCHARVQQRAYAEHHARCSPRSLPPCTLRQHNRSSAGSSVQRKHAQALLPPQLQTARHSTRHVVQAAAWAASSPAETAVSTSIILKQCELTFGDKVKAVGQSDLFGSWDSDKAPELLWQEGHDWVAKLDVPPGDCTFKLVIVNVSGESHWESGDNRSVMVPGDAAGGEVTIACHFNQTAATEVQVTPAAVAQTNGAVRQSASNASPIDDLTDDFAAGDAAVQVPAVKEKAEDLQQQAEDVTDAKAAPTSAKEQAAAKVEKNVTEAAPEEDLGDTLSVLQGAESDLQKLKQPQASGSSTDADAASPAAPTQKSRPPPQKAQAEQNRKPASSESQGAQDDDAEKFSSFPTFGKSRVTNIARDGAITFTFEEDDDVDAKTLSRQLLGSP